MDVLICVLYSDLPQKASFRSFLLLILHRYCLKSGRFFFARRGRCSGSAEFVVMRVNFCERGDDFGQLFLALALRHVVVGTIISI